MYSSEFLLCHYCCLLTELLRLFVHESSVILCGKIGKQRNSSQQQHVDRGDYERCYCFQYFCVVNCGLSEEIFVAEK